MCQNNLVKSVLFIFVLKCKSQFLGQLYIVLQDRSVRIENIKILHALKIEWNQIGWFTLPIKWHPFGHEAIGHTVCKATKVTRWDQGATSISVSYIDY